ncbi:sialin-like isoform X2 [Lineus longissimus]|uniref:sialin-like isoform X2 n=1 Tax=Lineus longissimus TaxID=88925 RepID=UPI00315D1CDA
MVENVDEKSRLILAELNGKPKGCCQRHVLSVLGFLGFFMSYVLRVSFNVALVAMVNKTQTANTSHPSECPVDVHDNGTADDSSPTGEFDWSPQTQGTILGAFYYGYMITQIPGGIISERFGGKWPFGVGVLLTGILTLLTPVAARTDVSLLVVLRVLEGLGEGITIGAYYALIGKWSPPLERSFMVSLGFVGTEVGTVVAMPITGWLCEYGFDGGWPSAFYIFGSATCVWFLFWAVLVSSSPAEHPRISEEEKKYIIKMIGDSSKKLPFPWKELMTSPPIWSIYSVSIGWCYLFYTILTDLPTFIDTILQFDISKNGVLSSLPALAFVILGFTSGYIADLILAKGYLRLVTVRKLCTAIGMFLPAAAIIGAGYIGCNYILGVALLTISAGLQAVALSGYYSNLVDIAPPFAGTISGIGNTFGTAAGIAAPAVVGALTNNNQTQEQWRIIFLIAGFLSMVSSIPYLIFGTAERAPWSFEREENAPTKSGLTALALNTAKKKNNDEVRLQENLS